MMAIKTLKVPYLSQRDNQMNPYGSCNVTSVAMCLQYFGIVGTGDGQLEDQLYKKCANTGLSRHAPADLAKLIRSFGLKDDFRPDAKWADAKQHLINGNPLIAHGWFTKSGHIIVIVGFDDVQKDWIVHDPYGEYWPSGYDTTAIGAYQRYSYKLMQEICGTDGDLWLHFVSR